MPRAQRIQLARRLLGNYALQVLILGIRLLDQLLLPLYILAWGTDLYRDWLVLSSIIWLLTSCSFGTEEYFANLVLRSALGNDDAINRHARSGLFVSVAIWLLRCSARCR